MLKINTQEFLSKVLNSHFLISYLKFVYALNNFQIKLLIAITILLIAWLIYRRLGAGIFFVFLFVVMISYLIYKADLFSFYEKENSEYNARMQQVEIELNK